MKIWKLAVVTVLGMVSLTVLGLALRTTAAKRDFICYWSSARLLADHANPYDSAAVLHLENSAGGSYQVPLIMRNPPWVLVFVAPLGWLSPATAALFWEIALILAALLSVRLLQLLSPGRVPLVIYLFAPVMACAMAGQCSIFLLLGVCLFFWLESRRPFAAGLALTILCLKPHLAVLFWLVLVLDVVYRRRFRLIAGLTTGLALATAFAMKLDPQVWRQYLHAASTEHIDTQFFPNLSCALRILISRDAVWVQLLPTLVGLAFAGWLWRRYAGRWNWATHGAVLLAISVLSSPYSWLVDQALILPALLLYHRRASKNAAIVLGGVNAVMLGMTLKASSLSSPLYLWTGPAWLAWCAWVQLRPAGRPAPSVDFDQAPVAEARG